MKLELWNLIKHRQQQDYQKHEGFNATQSEDGGELKENVKLWLLL